MQPVRPSLSRSLSIAVPVALACFLGLDACWLTVMNARLYAPALGALLAPAVDGVAAAGFYAVYLAGLTVFAIRPALASGDSRAALRLGGSFGFVAYATYDLTNQATLANWPWAVTAADLAWGTVVSGLSSWAAAAVALRRARAARG